VVGRVFSRNEEGLVKKSTDNTEDATMSTIDIANKMLNDIGRHTSQRAERLARFIESHGLDGLTVEINNNYRRPPKPKSAKHYVLLGGTTYKYQVWAVIR
jgi:hypothetical protein